MSIDIAVALVVGFFVGGFSCLVLISLIVMAGRNDSDE